MSKKFQLKNGLKVLLLESHKSPVISVQMWVKTGSADEKKNEEGISHFIEHLVFKGTRKYKVGEIAAQVEASGGELNAYTSFDQTVFYVTISKQFSDVGLDVISEMMGFPTFDATEIDNEREVVIEEIKRGQDSLSRAGSQMMFSSVFKGHPYAIPVIGYEKNIRKFTPKKIADFFHSRYVPRNMFLVVSGDFESAEMKQKVQKYFGEFKDYKLRKTTRPKVKPVKKTQVKVEKSTFEQTVAYLAWPAPNVKHKDVSALEVMSLILGQGDSSRLVHSLRLEKPLTNSVGSYAFTPQDAGVLAISMGLNVENLQESLAKIKEHIVEIVNNPPSKTEMQKAVTNLASEQIYSLETVDGIARKAGTLEFYMGDHEYFKKYLKQLYALTPEDISRVAKKYFSADNLTVCVLSKTENENIKKTCQAFTKDLKTALKAKPSKKSKPVKFKPQKLSLKTTGGPATDIEEIAIGPGVTLLLKAQKETPTVSVRAGFLGGLRAEPTTTPGLTEMFSRVLTGGGKKFNETELNHRIDEMAAGLGAFAGRNSVGVSMDYLSVYEEKMFEVFEDVLTGPIFPSEVLEREKMIIKNQIKSRNDNPSQIAVLQFMSTLFDGHPYSRDMMGSQESVDKIQTQNLRDYYEKIIAGRNLTLTVVGDFDRSFWVDQAKKLAQKLPQGEKFESSFPLKPLKQEHYLYQESKKEQSHVIMGVRGLTITDEERYQLEVIQSILSGQGGRLFIELRDKNSLAYSVAPMRMEGLETGYFGAYIGCSPEKVKKAISMLKAEFQKLVDTKVPEQELLRAQRYIVGRHDIDLQRKSAISNSILFDRIYGLDPREGLDVAEKYFSVKAADLQALAAKLFKQHFVVSVVGPQNPF
ncbi:M16 family metallopeptidase [Bdellovibrio sp. HCB337]|uniref:M16 family metallopeptidase n=1 Tax=Bdellovibrio sp. HCB337 TaxID=3394358 RepID=UPI0039A66271